MTEVSYTKLFSSITDSTIWSESAETRIVWITMLAMCDKNGWVYASIPGLAHRAHVNIEETEKALNKFLSPDKYSRTPDNEGRRIEVIDGGWSLLNHPKYKAIRSADERREYQRNWIAEKRKAEKEALNVDTAVDNVERSLSMSTHTDTDTYTEKKRVTAKAGRYPKIDFSEQDGYTALLMETTLIAMNPGMKNPNLDLWSNTVRLMRERDGRTNDEIKELFLWANKDDFWHQNILSPEKLRKQWDTLVVQRKAKMNGGRNLSLPKIDEQLSGFAQKNNLPKANPGESYPQYRHRLNFALEK